MRETGESVKKRSRLKMTSKERVKKVLNFEKPDRVPIYDLIKDSIGPEFDFDMVLLNENKNVGDAVADKFKLKAAIGPFEDLSHTFGLERLLEEVAKNPAFISKELKKSAYKIIRKMKIAKDEHIDGIWLWSDMAYNKGLFFSDEFYRQFLFPLHKDICSYFSSLGLPVIFHSDGNLNSIMPLLIEAGFRGIHPVESAAGMDLKELKDKYRNKIVFLGSFSLDFLKSKRENGLLEDFKKRLETATENNGYVFGFESPIGKDIDIERYKKVLNIVREHTSDGRAKNKNYTG